ncbi:hypothetical protein TRVL_03400 [Trypanosoma vivax]|nr:hypothetical protein TRVL_03400 [Trypanosoma vivax]
MAPCPQVSGFPHSPESCRSAFFRLRHLSFKSQWSLSRLPGLPVWPLVKRAVTPFHRPSPCLLRSKHGLGYFLSALRRHKQACTIRGQSFLVRGLYPSKAFLLGC